MAICGSSTPVKIKMHRGILVAGPCATPTTTIARSSRSPALVWWYVPETAHCQMGPSCSFGLPYVTRLDKSNRVREVGCGCTVMLWEPSVVFIKFPFQQRVQKTRTWKCSYLNKALLNLDMIFRIRLSRTLQSLRDSASETGLRTELHGSLNAFLQRNA